MKVVSKVLSFIAKIFGSKWGLLILLIILIVASIIFPGFGAFLLKVWNAVVNFISSAWTFIKEGALAIWKSISTWATELYNSEASFLSKVWKGIKRVGKFLWNTAKALWSGAKKVVETVADAAKAVGSAAGSLIGSIADFIGDNPLLAGLLAAGAMGWLDYALIGGGLFVVYKLITSDKGERVVINANPQEPA